MINVIACVLILVTMYLCAVACKRIALSRNRGPEEWFVCGVVAGPIAVLTVWLLPALPPGSRSAGAAGKSRP